MYDLTWRQISHEVSYNKSGKSFKMKVTLAIIPDDKLMRYDRALQRPLQQEPDGGTTVDLAPGALEENLFDEFFVSVEVNKQTPTGTREEILKKIPAEVKRAVIREGTGGVFPVEERQASGGLDDLTSLGNTLKIQARANGIEHETTHHMKEPSAEDELTYRKATAGSLKTLPGRRKPQFMVVEDFTVYGKLYDRLIESVEGYCEGATPFELNSAPPVQEGQKPEPLPRVHKIPYTHKKTVVKQLFGAASIREEEQEQFF